MVVPQQQQQQQQQQQRWRQWRRRRAALVQRAALAVALSCCAVAQAAAAAAAGPARRVEFYGFSPEQTKPTFRGYDWAVLTASAWRTDPELVSLASAHGARVELNAGDARPVMGDPGRRAAWVEARIAEARATGAGGINFDLELEMKPGSQAAADYTSLVRETADAARAALPGFQVSVDVPWSPYDIDGRNYDWHGLAAAADLLFIMLYDTQSQILGRCIASANSPLDTVRRGVQQWLNLGVPPSKLVLGLPWYGYDYPCQPHASGAHATPPPADVDVCMLASVPFRGVSCSDAAGAQKCYFEIQQLLADGANTTEVRWDATQQSPYFNYRAADGSIHQVHYDTPESLALKYQVAAEHGLAGIGVWNLDCLAYDSPDPRVQQDTRAMWAAVRAAVDAWDRHPAAPARSAQQHQQEEQETVEQQQQQQPQPLQQQADDDGARRPLQQLPQQQRKQQPQFKQQQR